MDTLQPQDGLLSARELEVLQLMARGHKNRDIALSLKIEERTVRFHIGNILEKLQARSRTEAVYHAFRNGWITD